MADSDDQKWLKEIRDLLGDLPRRLVAALQAQPQAPVRLPPAGAVRQSRGGDQNEPPGGGGGGGGGSFRKDWKSIWQDTGPAGALVSSFGDLIAAMMPGREEPRDPSTMAPPAAQRVIIDGPFPLPVHIIASHMGTPVALPAPSAQALAMAAPPTPGIPHVTATPAAPPVVPPSSLFVGPRPAAPPVVPPSSLFIGARPTAPTASVVAPSVAAKPVVPIPSMPPAGNAGPAQAPLMPVVRPTVPPVAAAPAVAPAPVTPAAPSAPLASPSRPAPRYRVEPYGGRFGIFEGKKPAPVETHPLESRAAAMAVLLNSGAPPPLGASAAAPPPSMPAMPRPQAAPSMPPSLPQLSPGRLAAGGAPSVGSLAGPLAPPPVMPQAGPGAGGGGAAVSEKFVEAIEGLTEEMKRAREEKQRASQQGGTETPRGGNLSNSPIWGPGERRQERATNERREAGRSETIARTAAARNT